MKRSSVPANKADRLVQFRLQDAQRIASAVHIVETERRAVKPSRLPRAFAGGKKARLCKTGAKFSKGTIATLDVWEDGTPPNETQSQGQQIEDVVNKYADIEANKFVSVSLHGNGHWYVISAEC